MHNAPLTGSQLTGLVARFKLPTGNRRIRKPVVAICDGTAMVLNDGSRLTTAYQQPGYEGLTPVPVAVGALPAEPGLRVRRLDGAGDDATSQTWTTPVVGWLAYSDAGTLPLLAVGQISQAEEWCLVYQDGTESDGGDILETLIPWCGKCASTARRYTADGELCSACHADHPDHGGFAPVANQSEDAPAS